MPRRQKPPESDRGRGEGEMSRSNRLRKSSREKMLFGVAGGLADYFDIDPVIVRIFFVCISLLVGTGFLVYVALAIIMPSAEAEGSGGNTVQDSVDELTEDIARAGARVGDELRDAMAESSFRRRSLALVLIAIGVVLLLSNLGLMWWFNWGLFWAFVLVIIGVVVLVRRRSDR